MIVRILLPFLHGKVFTKRCTMHRTLGTMHNAPGTMHHAPCTMHQLLITARNIKKKANGTTWANSFTLLL